MIVSIDALVDYYEQQGQEGFEFFKWIHEKESFKN